MKKINKIIAILAAASMLGVNAAAKEVTLLNDKAEILYRLDLIRGVSDNGFDPGLGYALTREAAVAAVLRVTGHENDVYQNSSSCSFADVSEWAKPYVAYGEVIGLCRGIDGTYFGASENVSLRQLCTMYLRMLGYELNGDIYENALETAKTLIMCSEETDRTGTRSDLVDISYNALYVSMYGTATALIRQLADTGRTKLSDIAATGDDGLISAYYSSEAATGAVGEELKGDLENALTYSCADNAAKGMSVVSSGENVTMSSERCVKLDAGKSLSFKLDDGYITSSDKYFTAVIKYFDNGADRIRVAYNAANTPYYSGYILKTNTNTWKEARVVIKNAQFSHAQSDGADISIVAENEGGTGTAEFISEVMLVKQTAEDQPINDIAVEPVITAAGISFDGLTPSVCLTQMTNGNESAYNHTKQTEIGGETCISIGVNKRCVLQLDDDFIEPDENKCTINVTYFDGGTNKIRFSYSTEAVRYKDVYINKTGTNTWKTYSITVDDASFMNRQDAGIDFSIWGVATKDSVTGDETEYISRVEIVKN